MSPLEHRVVAGGEVVKRRILDDEMALTHRAADVDDRMARRATQPGLRLGRVDLLAYRVIEPAVEEDRVVVTAGAPLRRLGADDVLHVFDRFAIPLVVERREMMGGRAPLLVDVGVTAPARGAGQEEAGRNEIARVGVGRRRKERARGAGPLGAHARRCVCRIRDPIGLSPSVVQYVAGERGGQYRGQTGDERAADRPGHAEARREPDMRHQQRRTEHRASNVRVEQELVLACRPQHDDRQTQQQPDTEKRRTERDERTGG